MKLNQTITLKKNDAYIHLKTGGYTHKKVIDTVNINANNLIQML
jgi:hypothetical protein